MIGRVLAATMIVSAIASTAIAAEPLQPTSKWIVDFDEAQCVASRNYGDKDRPLYLTFKSPAVGESMQMAVIRPAGSATPEPEEKRGLLALGNAEPLKIGVLAVTVKKTKQRFFRVNLSADQIAALRNSKTISLSAGGELHETFVVDEVPALLKVMDNCVVDLRKVWNASNGDGQPPSKQRSARGNLQAVFKPEDYPADAMFDGVGGTAKFVVLIDENGKVADCTIVETSGIASLDAQSCGIIQTRVTFKPAIGLDGKPTKDTWSQRVTWRVEEW